ncbi:MAG: MFS transporter [Chloroflexi bacterium]|nr:MAG: MFS transporter [Chloroflexota bacterium]
MIARLFAAVRAWLSLFRSPRARPYLVVTLAVDSALVFVFLVAVQSYLPEDYGGGAALPGYALAAYGVSKLGGQFLAGRLVDRISAIRALKAGAGLILAGQIALFGAALTPALVIPAAALYGFGGATVWPAVYAMAAAEFAQEERGKLSSGLTMTSGAAIALALAAGFVLPTSFPYAAAIALSLCGGIVAFVAARSFRQTAIPAGSEMASLKEGHEPLRGLVIKILHPRRLTFSLMLVLQSALLAGLLAVFRAYGRDLLGVNFREEALMLAPAGAAGALAVIVGGSLSDRVGRIPVLGGGYLIACFSIWLLSAATAPAAAAPLAAGAAFGLGLALPSVNALSIDLSRTSGAGSLLGWFLTMEGVGYALGPAGAGWINESAGVAVVFWLAGGLAAALAIIALVPPIWIGLSRGLAAPARRANLLVSGSLKGALLLSVAFPVAATYFAYAPSSQIYGHIISHGSRDQMLDQHHVKGTFFVVGQNATVHPEVVRDLVHRGHLIGNHSYRHQKRDAVLDLGYGELGKAERAIAEAAGVCPAFYRPPNGFHTPWQLRAVSHQHMRTVTWDVIPRDWRDPPPEVIVQRVLDSVRPGSIVLLHDGDNTNQGTSRAATLAALPGLIDGLRAKGYRIVGLDELLSAPAYLSSCSGLSQQAAQRQS